MHSINWLILGKKYCDFFSDSMKLQLVGMIFTLVAILVAFSIHRLRIKEQLNHAVIALMDEIKLNKKMIAAYIQHSDVGANLTQGTYELNVPERIAYEQYLSLVCKYDLLLTGEIRELYLRFSACKVLIEMIHSYVAYNLLAMLTKEISKNSFDEGIIMFNVSLRRLSGEIYDVEKRLRLIDKLGKLQQ